MFFFSPNKLYHRCLIGPSIRFWFSHLLPCFHQSVSSRLLRYDIILFIVFSISVLKVSLTSYRSSRPEVYLGKGVLQICSKFTGKHPCRSVISIKLLCNFIEIALRHGCSPVNLLHIFGTPFPKSTSEWLLLKFPFVQC